MATNLYRYDSWTKSATGPAIPGADIYVCTQPANTASAPPSPLAAIFADSGGNVPITQPLVTDGFGHVDFYAVAGLYTIVVVLNGVVQQVYADQSLGGVGTGTGGSLVLSTNSAQNANQLVLNLESTDGSVTLTNDSSGNTNLKANVSTSVPFMFGPGIFTLAGVAATASRGVTDSNNRVFALQFSIPYKCTFSQMTFSANSGHLGGSTYGIGIYDSTGAKYWETGAIAIANGSLTNYTVTKSLTLNPGTYYLAWSAANSGADTIWGWDASTYSYDNGTGDRNIVNQTVVRFGYSANAMSAGVLPATLGALTVPATGAAAVVPSVFFQ